jgi:hypothetical protein
VSAFEDMKEPLLSHRFLWIKALSAAYVLGIPLAHGLLPSVLVWEVALFFLIAMLFTYPLAAFSTGHAQRVELFVSLGLAALGVLGYLTHPLLIILAIFGHGVWDLAKHKGCGVPFFGWYVKGCVLVDFSYAAVLLLFLVSGGH